MIDKAWAFITSFNDPMLLLYFAPVVVAILYFITSAGGQSGE